MKGKHQYSLEKAVAMRQFRVERGERDGSGFTYFNLATTDRPELIWHNNWLLGGAARVIFRAVVSSSP